MAADLDLSKAPAWATHYGTDTDRWNEAWYRVEDGEAVAIMVPRIGGEAIKIIGKQGRPIHELIPINRDQLIVDSKPVTAEQVDLDAPLEWDGSGLPPAGTVCLAWFNGSAQGEVEVKYSGECMVLWNIQYQREQCAVSDSYRFEPILTAEQKAAKEREAAIKAIDDILAIAIEDDQPMAEALYKAGYRKQESEQ